MATQCGQYLLKGGVADAVPTGTEKAHCSWLNSLGRYGFQSILPAGATQLSVAVETIDSSLVATVQEWLERSWQLGLPVVLPADATQLLVAMQS